MYIVRMSAEDLDRVIECLTRYASYLVDHALHVEAAHTPQADAAGAKLREWSKKVCTDIEIFQKIRQRPEDEAP